MTAITLGFKALDVHELGCHFVARHAGIYASRGLDVRLLDTRPIADDELPVTVISVACGSALLRWLRGERVKVVFVAATKPMFWLCGRNGIEKLDDLAGRSIAAYPEASPPAWFLRVVLEEAGLDPADRMTVIPLPDDAARLAAVESGEAAAALVSSATSLRALEAAGLRRLLCLGDRLRVPTTGLAAHRSLLETDPDTVHRVRGAFRAALRVIHEDESVLRASLREAGLLDELGPACSLLREFYSRDGSVAPAAVLPGVQRIAHSMKLPLPTDVGTLYACGEAT